MNHLKNVGKHKPDTANTVKRSRWWATTSPETCTAELE